MSGLLPAPILSTPMILLAAEAVGGCGRLWAHRPLLLSTLHLHPAAMWWNEETLQEALEVLTGVGLRSAAGCGDGRHGT